MVLDPLEPFSFQPWKSPVSHSDIFAFMAACSVETVTGCARIGEFEKAEEARFARDEAR
jgi:hypothetical protein